jgi:hypothetical protein
MKKIFALITLSILVACSKGGGGATTIDDPHANKNANGYTNGYRNSTQYRDDAHIQVVFDIPEPHTFCAGGPFTILPNQPMTLAEARVKFKGLFETREEDLKLLKSDRFIAKRLRYNPEVPTERWVNDPNPVRYSAQALAGRALPQHGGHDYSDRDGDDGDRYFHSTRSSTNDYHHFEEDRK